MQYYRAGLSFLLISRSLNSSETKLWDADTGLCMKAYRDPLGGIKQVNQLCVWDHFIACGMMHGLYNYSIIVLIYALQVVNLALSMYTSKIPPAHSSM